MDDPRTDRELVEAVRQGDHQAWRKLIERHLPPLGAYIGARLRRPGVVDEILEEATKSAWKHLDNLGDADEFPRWFRKMGANVAMRWHKMNPDEPLAEIISLERASRAEADPDLIRKLDAAIGRLHPDQRMAIEQKFRGGLSGERLWQTLRVDPQEGRELLRQALRSLDRRLGPALD